MVLGEQLQRWFRQREQERVDRAVAERVAEARAEAEAEIRAAAFSQARTQLDEWNRRRLEAEANNEPFDEPPPIFGSDGENGTQ